MAAATAIIIILPLYCCYCCHGGYQAVAVALQLCNKKAFQLYPHPMDIHDPHKGSDIRDTHPKKEHNDMGPEIPTSREQTDTCENITFPQLRLRAVKSICLLIDIQYA